MLNVQLLFCPEPSLIVTDFIIFVYSSSCSSLFFGLLFPYLVHRQFLGIPSCPWGAIKHKKRSEIEAENDLPNTEILKSGIIRLASENAKIPVPGILKRKNVLVTS